MAPIIIRLKWTDEQIEEEINRHVNIRKDYFYYNLGKGYYNLNNETHKSLRAYFKAESIAC